APRAGHHPGVVVREEVPAGQGRRASGLGHHPRGARRRTPRDQVADDPAARPGGAHRWRRCDCRDHPRLGDPARLSRRAGPARPPSRRLWHTSAIPRRGSPAMFRKFVVTPLLIGSLTLSMVVAPATATAGVISSMHALSSAMRTAKITNCLM